MSNGSSVDGDAAYVNAILRDTRSGDSTVLDYARMTFEVVTREDVFEVKCLKCSWEAVAVGEFATTLMRRHVDTGHFKELAR